MKKFHFVIIAVWPKESKDMEKKKSTEKMKWNWKCEKEVSFLFYFWNRTEFVKCKSRNEINRSNFRPIYPILLASRRVGRSLFKWIIIPYIILHSEFAYKAIAIRRKYVKLRIELNKNGFCIEYSRRTVDFSSFSLFWIEIWEKLM